MYEMEHIFIMRIFYVGFWYANVKPPGYEVAYIVKSQRGLMW